MKSKSIKKEKIVQVEAFYHVNLYQNDNFVDMGNFETMDEAMRVYDIALKAIYSGFSLNEAIGIEITPCKE